MPSITRDAVDAALVGCVDLSVAEGDDPVVQGTGDVVAVDDPLGELAAPVGTAVVQGEDAIVQGAEHRDVAAGGSHDARTLARDVVQGADVDPGADASEAVHRYDAGAKVR